MRRSLLALAAFSLLLPAIAAPAAEPICDRSRSLKHCYQSLRAVPVVDAAEERIATAATPGTTSSLLNLIPSSAASLGISGLTDTSDNLSYDKVFELGDGWKLDLGLTVFRDPALFEALQEALPEENRSQIVETLSQDIGDFAKVDGKAVLSWEGKLGDHRFGRDPERYQEGSVTGWVEEGFTRFKPEGARDPLARWGIEEAADSIAAYPGEFWSDPLKELVDVLGEGEVRKLEAGVKQAADDAKRVAAGFESWLGTFAEQAGQLVTNQPQLLFEGEYDERSDLTGPSQWSARLCFEMGLSGNLNDFRQWARKQDTGKYAEVCGPTAGTGADAEYGYDCLQAYLGTRSGVGLRESAAMRRGHRLAIAAAYTETRGLHVDRPDLGAEFDLDPSETLTGSATYGLYLPKLRLPNLLWYFTPSAGSQPTGFSRFDLQAKYDDVSGDPMKQSRFVATATLSQKMSNNTTLSLSAVYANKPEYLGEVDEEVSAHFGFKWEADRSQPDGG